jgi:hypothetical protein
MLDLARVRSLVEEVAQTILPGRRVEGVSVEPAVDMLGGDSLRITAVVGETNDKHPTGEDVIAFERLPAGRQPVDPRRPGGRCRL